LLFRTRGESAAHKLRAIFNVFDREESAIAAVLEQWVESGELEPLVISNPT